MRKLTSLNFSMGKLATLTIFAALDLIMLTPQARALDQTWESKIIEISPEQINSEPLSSVTVAVIDTGADVAHPSLQAHLWINSGETGRDSAGQDRSQNGIDDDQNGFIDDVHGWNFADQSRKLKDLHGHGTHVAGIISQTAPNAKIMVLKYFDPKAPSDLALDHTVNAIRYAVKMGARIINYSAGGRVPCEAERVAIDEARKAGVIFIAAAGNEAANSDYYPYFPADYRVSNIVSVTAVSSDRKILRSSNYGIHSVHIAAPGEAILSTAPGGKFVEMTGTSQATAFVSGVAALLLGREPEIRDPELIAQHLINSGSTVELLVGKTQESSIINAQRALAIRDSERDAFGINSTNTSSIDPSLFFSDTRVAQPVVHPELASREASSG